MLGWLRTWSFATGHTFQGPHVLLFFSPTPPYASLPKNWLQDVVPVLFLLILRPYLSIVPLSSYRVPDPRTLFLGHTLLESLP